VNRDRLESLLRLVAHTRDEELSCSDCLTFMPQYVDLELADEAPDARLPLFRQHLEQCAVCHEEYVTVRDLARLEAEGRSPSIDDLRRSL
jgi:hypothetical protein